MENGYQKMNNTVFIVDTYSPHLPRDMLKAVRHTFFLNDISYAIYEVPITSDTFEWPRPVDEAEPPAFRCFTTYDEAYCFMLYMKRLNK